MGMAEHKMEKDEVAHHIKNIAVVCRSILNDPQTHLDNIAPILQATETKNCECRRIAMLSLVKVFKNIIPLYKIRVHSEKVKSFDEQDYITAFDTQTLRFYTMFVRKIVQYDDLTSYRCACYLLESADHFNLADRLVAKVLRGTLHDACRGFCTDTLLEKIRSDKRLEITSTIVLAMCDLKFHPSVLAILLEIDLMAPEDGDEEIPEESSSVSEKKKLKREIADNLLRIYLTILKEERVDFYKHLFSGLSICKDYIKASLYEGLYLLLKRSLAVSSISTKISCSQSIIDLFGDKNYDFKELADTLFDVTIPMKYRLSNHVPQIMDMIKKLFILRRQPANRARALLQRLMQLCLVMFVPDVRDIVDDMVRIYKIDVADTQVVGSGLYVQDASAIDHAAEKPFYEYFLYRKSI
jgi:nucleolar complex protein 3